MKTRSIPTFAYQLLLRHKAIIIGEPLFFHYIYNNKTHAFKASVAKEGLMVGTHCFNPSYAATQFLMKIGEKKPINGWIAWHNEAGRSLADLYKKILNIPLTIIPEDLESMTLESEEVYYKYPLYRDAVFF